MTIIAHVCIYNRTCVHIYRGGGGSQIVSIEVVGTKYERLRDSQSFSGRRCSKRRSGRSTRTPSFPTQRAFTFEPLSPNFHDIFTRFFFITIRGTRARQALPRREQNKSTEPHTFLQ